MNKRQWVMLVIMICGYIAFFTNVSFSKPSSGSQSNLFWKVQSVIKTYGPKDAWIYQPKLSVNFFNMAYHYWYWSNNNMGIKDKKEIK